MKTTDRPRVNLAMFLYILLRDYLPSGQVEEIMEKHVEKNPENRTIRYSNPYIVAHVDDILDRLIPPNVSPWTVEKNTDEWMKCIKTECANRATIGAYCVEHVPQL